MEARLKAGVGEGVVEVEVSVRDTGIGIPCDKQRLLFHKFQQVDASTSRLHGGTGLGLVISARLAEAMGGTMWVESEAGRGAVFRFTAKFGICDTKPEAEGEVGEGVRVLVVVHSPSLARCLHEVVGGWGMGCTSVAEGQEALQVLREAESRGRPFHLILADMWMYVPLGSQGHLAGEPSVVDMPPGSTANNGLQIGTPPGSPSEDKDPSGVPPGFQRVVTFDLLEGLASEPHLLARLGSGAGSGNSGSGGRQALPVVFLTTALHTDATRCRAASIPFFLPKPFKRSALRRCICRALRLPQV